MFYGMPIHIIRDVALTIRSFYKRIRDFVQYKHATKDMNARYPDATAEEISREDVCIICRENMTVWQDSSTQQDPETIRAEHQPIDERQRAKKLPCGHLLHFACLRSWLERQQICPTCRTPVLTNNTGPPNLNQGAGLAVQRDPGAMNQPAGGAHVYTFGPFRLVFGARQINNNPQPNPGTAAAVATRNPSGPIHGRSPVTIGPADIGIQAQLDQIEQYIAREISNFNFLSDQLQVVRALQTELARLRTARGLPGNAISAANYHSRQIPQQQTIQAYQQVALGTGQQDLPTGLTLPENWTLHALQRVPGSTNMGTRPQSSSEGPSQQAQPISTYPQNVHLAPAVDSSSDSAYAPGSASDLASTEVQGSESSGPEQSHSSEQVDSSGEVASEKSTSLPDWGATAVPGQASGGQTVEGKHRSENFQNKGKGRVVTVEDATDDAVD